MISWTQIGYGAVLSGLLASAALATAAVALSAGVLPSAPARRVVGYAAVCAVVAFLVDVYLY